MRSSIFTEKKSSHDPDSMLKLPFTIRLCYLTAVTLSGFTMMAKMAYPSGTILRREADRYAYVRILVQGSNSSCSIRILGSLHSTILESRAPHSQRNKP